MQVKVKGQTIIYVKGQSAQHKPDLLAVEEPLEVRLVYGLPEHRQEKSISVTMRTPGNDPELVAGFLFTENIINTGRSLLGIRPCIRSQRDTGLDNVWIAELDSSLVPDMAKLERHFYTSSSCGVCGKSSIAAVIDTGCIRVPNRIEPMDPTLLQTLPARLQQAQLVFKHTGGLHASALFNLDGELEYLYEDVGRHNALDKLIGRALLEGNLPLHNKVLLLSGRVSFELVQKAARAGIELIAAIGAPSSLAIDLAAGLGITVIGFLRENTFNIYTHPGRISLTSANEHLEKK